MEYAIWQNPMLILFSLFALAMLVPMAIRDARQYPEELRKWEEKQKGKGK